MSPHYDLIRTFHLKTATNPCAIIKADYVHGHVKGLITFECDGVIVAQASVANIEYWALIEDDEAEKLVQACGLLGLKE